MTSCLHDTGVMLSEYFLGFICNCLIYFTTAKISFTSILYPQFTLYHIYTSVSGRLGITTISLNLLTVDAKVVDPIM